LIETSEQLAMPASSSAHAAARGSARSDPAPRCDADLILTVR